MFRGHAKARWMPTSSLDRYCSDFGFPARKKAVVESFLLQDFYRHLSAQIDLHFSRPPPRINYYNNTARRAIGRPSNTGGVQSISGAASSATSRR